MKEKLTNVTIDVPFKSSGGIIHQHQVTFEVQKEDETYILVPLLSASERMVANLPEELRFTMVDEAPVSLRGKMDGNFHVIQDAVAALKSQQHLI